jgi:nitrite reductase/ring-hydroxylating ferredoxin subunit
MLHMNALLSMGNISNERIVTCSFHGAFHGASFDVSTGRNAREPNLTPPHGMESLPEKWRKFMEYIGQLMSHIKTYYQQTYETSGGVEGDLIKIKV